jgi:hypothetical protein
LNIQPIGQLGYNLPFNPLEVSDNWPQLIVSHIFLCFSIKDLYNTRIVNKNWKHIISKYLEQIDIKKLFPNLKRIDEQAWSELVNLERYGLSFDGLIPIPNETLIPELTRFDSLPLEFATHVIGVEIPGFTLLTLPKGLSLKKIIKISKDREDMLVSVYKDPSSELKEYYESHLKVETDESCTVLISHSILKQSFHENWKTQKKSLYKHECEMPGALAIITLAFWNYKVGLQWDIDTTTEGIDKSCWEIRSAYRGFEIRPSKLFSSRNIGVVALRNLSTPIQKKKKLDKKCLVS